MGDPPPDDGDANRRGRGGGGRGERPRFVGCAFGAAILAAPFLALLYGPVAGLTVSTLALAATAYLAFEGARGAEGGARRRLRAAGAVNVVLAAVCAAVVLALVT